MKWPKPVLRVVPKKGPTKLNNNKTNGPWLGKMALLSLLLEKRPPVHLFFVKVYESWKKLFFK
jgi:hypothetical protein